LLICFISSKLLIVETSEYDDEGDACEMANVPMEQLGDGRFRVKMNIAR